MPVRKAATRSVRGKLVGALTPAPPNRSSSKAGSYAIAVRHDVQGNGSDWNDGGGFSRNPRLSLLDLKPKYAEVNIPVGNGVKPVDVVLNYRRGLKIAPIGSN